MEKTKNKILITGIEGMLGRALYKKLSGRYSLTGPLQKELDITDGKKVNRFILDIKPAVIIHTAALTDVDGCEDKPDLAYKVNALGTKNIADSSKEVGANLIYISTDYIFDGTKDKPYTEDSAPNPISVYGRTKLAGEKFVAESLANFVIIRSSWLFGKGKVGFVEKIIEQAKAKKEISVVADKYGSPTYVDDLAQAIGQLIGLIENRKFIPQNCMLHITNSGYCSWLEYAQKIIEFAEIKGIILKPVGSNEFKFKAKRPRFSVLDNARYNKLTGQPLRSWQQALGDYLKCLRN